MIPFTYARATDAADALPPRPRPTARSTSAAAPTSST